MKINDIIHRFEPVDFTFSNRHSNCRDSIMLYSYGVLVFARLIKAFGGSWLSRQAILTLARFFLVYKDRITNRFPIILVELYNLWYSYIILKLRLGTWSNQKRKKKGSTYMFSMTA